MGQLVINLVAVLCFVLGMATVWLPIPTGLILMAVGLGVLLMNSPHARKQVKGLRRRYPKLDAKLRGAERFLPKRLRKALAKTRAKRAPDAATERLS